MKSYNDNKNDNDYDNYNDNDYEHDNVQYFYYTIASLLN